MPNIKYPQEQGCPITSTLQTESTVGSWTIKKQKTKNVNLNFRLFMGF